MLSTSFVDPLLASPGKARRHDDDMAALQTMHLPPLESSEAAEEDEDEEADPAFRQMMNRGHYLRQLRLLALADERERQQAQQTGSAFCEEKKDDDGDGTAVADAPSLDEALDDKVTVLPNKEKILDYYSYLAHQRYHDDLKHVDMTYIDFGNILNRMGEDCGKLVVEQRKRLGKGGLCWDAGYVLGEHVIAREEEWSGNGGDDAAPRIVELGAGTGLTGLMIAKATRSEVVVTDLPELEGLLGDNVRRNFGDGADEDSNERSENLLRTTADRARGTVSSRVLRWGVEDDYGEVPYDVIVGADIVTSLYDPVALARTVHALSGPKTRVYISGKLRLDRPHEEFDAEMHRLFERVERMQPRSRLKSPNVFIIYAEGKR